MEFNVCQIQLGFEQPSFGERRSKKSEPDSKEIFQLWHTGQKSRSQAKWLKSGVEFWEFHRAGKTNIRVQNFSRRKVPRKHSP